MIDRRKMFATWLSPFDPEGFLFNRKAPDVPNFQKELTELVEVVSPHLPNLEEAQMVEFLTKMGRKVRAEMTHRGWPVDREFIEAIRATRQAPKAIPPEHRIMPPSQPVNRITGDRANEIWKPIRAAMNGGDTG